MAILVAVKFSRHFLGIIACFQTVLNGEALVSFEASNQPAGNDHHKQFSNLWGHRALNIVTVWMYYMIVGRL